MHARRRYERSKRLKAGERRTRQQREVRHALAYHLRDGRVFHDEHAARRPHLRQKAAARCRVNDSGRLQLRPCQIDQRVALRCCQEVVQKEDARVPRQHLAAQPSVTRSDGEQNRGRVETAEQSAPATSVWQARRTRLKPSPSARGRTARAARKRTSRPTSCRRRPSWSTRVSGEDAATHEPATRGSARTLSTTPASGGLCCSLLSTTSVEAPVAV